MKREGTSQLALALSLCGMLLLLLIPLSPWMLDLMLAFNLLLSLFVVFLALSITSTLEFSTFPSVLLFLTLFRLALNIASTRMILSEGKAGKIIATFGDVVTGGSPFIGLILFSLITVINFIVITKGAGRIAEVSARFTLEALPGKQAAIESELNSGSLNGEEAKAARGRLGAETEFYGAMDGASKFVRGDAIASVVITLVNGLGGLFVGLFSGKMSFAECVKTYTNLTIGDGLVTQLPALLISLGGALMVTRASQGSLAPKMLGQLFGKPAVMLLGGVALFLFALLPQMPHLLLMCLAAPWIIFSWKRMKKASVATESQPEKLSPPTIELLLGMRKLHLAEQLLGKVAEVRETIHEKWGVRIPAIHIRDELTLPSESFRIKIGGVAVWTGEGDLEEILSTLERCVIGQAHTFLTRQEVLLFVERAKEKDAAVCDELIPKKMSLGELLKILQNLVKEGFSLADPVAILETIADHLGTGERPDCDLLSEQVRKRFCGKRVSDHLGEEEALWAITLDPKVEQMISASVKREHSGSSVQMRPMTLEKIEKELHPLMKKASTQQLKMVLLTSPSCRRLVSALFEHHRSTLPVFSYAEIDKSMTVNMLGSVSSEVLI